jgi:hypothetical protein
MIVTDGTRLIGVGTGDYPLYLADIRVRESAKSFSATPSEELVAELGYAVVHPTEKPQGEIVTEGAPALVEGRYEQTWLIGHFTPAERLAHLNQVKEQLGAAMDLLRDSELATGFRYVFPAPYGELGVQLRPQDCVNLLGLRVGAEAAISAGYPQMPSEFRSYENINVEMTAADMVQMTNAALTHTKKVYAATWVYKDQIKNATTLAELPVIPSKIEVD